jgi:serine protease Do
MRQPMPNALSAPFLVVAVAISWGASPGRAQAQPLVSARAVTDQAAPLGFHDIVAKAKAAVVTVLTLSKLQPTGLENPGGARPRSSARGKEQAPGAPQYEISALQTSGFFVSADGYIVVSHEAVEDAAQIQITTPNNEILPARIIRDNPQSGLALLKIDRHRPFAYAEFKTGEAHAGDWIVAIGDPFGIGLTMTAGIIAGEVSPGPSSPAGRMVELDVPANMGSAGSPAFDTDGKVAAVISSWAPPGNAAGVAFAIPASTVRKFVQHAMIPG